jgi:hypothetical protein
MAVPEDMTPYGQFVVYLERYATGCVQSKRWEDVVAREAPFNDGEGTIWIRSGGLFRYLGAQYFRFKNEDIYEWLRRVSLSRPVSANRSVFGRSRTPARRTPCQRLTLDRPAGFGPELRERRSFRRRAPGGTGGT